MTVLVRYPGEFTYRTELPASVPFSIFWRELARSRDILDETASRGGFYGRFLLVVNGLRVYDWDRVVTPEDTVIVIASSKLFPPQSWLALPAARHDCSFCERHDVVYADIRRAFGPSIYFCSRCLVEHVEKTAFGNLAHYNIPDGATIDMGISGERDSMITLHLLQLFRAQTSAKFGIHCTFNEIGLGEYDARRRQTVEAIHLDQPELDVLQINSLQLPLFSYASRNATNELGFADNVCNMCGEGNIYRPFGTFFDGIVRRCSGGVTVEDRIMSGLQHPAGSPPTTRVDCSIPAFRNRRWLSVLEGLSEDCLAIYAALRNLDYCIADCPLADIAPAYQCRRHVLANYKAVMPDYKALASDVPISSTLSLWGTLSGNREIRFPSTCFWCEDCQEYHDLGGRTVADVFERENAANHSLGGATPRDVYEAIAKLFVDSEERWLAETVGNPDMQSVRRAHYRLRMSPDYQLLYARCCCLVYDRAADVVTLLALPAWQKALLQWLEAAPEPVGLQQAFEVCPEVQAKDVLMAIQKWIALDLLEAWVGDRRKGRPTVRPNISLHVVDCAHFFTGADLALMKECLFDGCELDVSATDSPDDLGLTVQPGNAFAVMLAVSEKRAELRQVYSIARQQGFAGDSVYVFPGNPMTVAMGCFECLDSQGFVLSTCNPSRRFTAAQRMRVLSVLMDLYDIDQCSRLQGWRAKNIAYYLNPRTNRKIKEFRPCTCQH